MRTLTPEGEKIVNDIAQRHGLSADAVKTLLEATANSGGGMAQFAHPELGGAGQWLRGGMTMIGDMFNSPLKAKVDAVCTELSSLLSTQSLGASKASFQAQSQNGDALGGELNHSGLFTSEPGESSGNWWPAGLGDPAAAGAQNSVRYAYFPEQRRIAIDRAGQMEVFDTLDHFIQGFGQQQSGDASITFTSQHGLVPIDSLPRVLHAVAQKERIAGGQARKGSRSPDVGHVETAPPASSEDIFATLERLAELKEKGVLTAEEFNAKKAELLTRL